MMGCFTCHAVVLISIVTVAAWHVDCLPTTRGVLDGLWSAWTDVDSQAPTTAPYDVISSNILYETRRYQFQLWACVQHTDQVPDPNGRRAFFKLFDYISGHNERKEKMEMTTPIIMNPNKQWKFGMCFYIPGVLQMDPPAPAGPDVFIVRLPEEKVYVSKFIGEATEEEWLQQEEDFRSILKESVAVEEHKVLRVQYSAPWQFFLRTNEIWLFEKP